MSKITMLCNHVIEQHCLVFIQRVLSKPIKYTCDLHFKYHPSISKEISLVNITQLFNRLVWLVISIKPYTISTTLLSFLSHVHKSPAWTNRGNLLLLSLCIWLLYFGYIRSLSIKVYIAVWQRGMRILYVLL